MGLRESIIGIVWGTTPKDSEIIADKILKEIEKRIDKKIDTALNNEQIITLMSVKEMLK